jgi:hypothetical protein
MDAMAHPKTILNTEFSPILLLFYVFDEGVPHRCFPIIDMLMLKAQIELMLSGLLFVRSYDLL